MLGRHRTVAVVARRATGQHAAAERCRVEHPDVSFGAQVQQIVGAAVQHRVAIVRDQAREDAGPDELFQQHGRSAGDANRADHSFVAQLLQCLHRPSRRHRVLERHPLGVVKMHEWKEVGPQPLKALGHRRSHAIAVERTILERVHLGDHQDLACSGLACQRLADPALAVPVAVLIAGVDDAHRAGDHGLDRGRSGLFGGALAVAQPRGSRGERAHLKAGGTQGAQGGRGHGRVGHR